MSLYDDVLAAYQQAGLPAEELADGRLAVDCPDCDQPAVLVADLDLDQRRDWLELFPFLTTRRPDAYGSLAD